MTHWFSMNTHQGTHLDAPAHYIKGGKTIDKIDLNIFFGKAKVIDLRGERGNPITAKKIKEKEQLIEKDDRIILLTGDVDENFYKEDFFDQASHLTTEAAEWLVNKDISLLANDFITEKVSGKTRPVHTTLLDADIPIVEYICNIEKIADRNEVEFICLPMLISDFEASPTRVVAKI